MLRTFCEKSLCPIPNLHTAKKNAVLCPMVAAAQVDSLGNTGGNSYVGGDRTHAED